MNLSEEQTQDNEYGVEQVDSPKTEPDPDYVCEMLAWIGTDLVECLDEQGQSCKFACPSDDFTVFCDCQPRRRMAQYLQR